MWSVGGERGGGVWTRTFLGLLSVVALIYLNFGDRISISLPTHFSFLWHLPQMPFVATNSTHFFLQTETVHGQPQPLFINGWNSYWLMDQSIWSRAKVSEMLQRGSAIGLTVCRTWAFSDGGSNALQISPGLFNERVFQALDFVIVEARRHKIRLILSLVNNLNAFGGKAQYVRWAQAAGVNVTSSTDSFFSHPTIKGYYKEYVKSILTRKNSFSGIKYSEEPAIFAWELMNEPRCFSSSSASVLQAWIAEMSAFIKSLDQKHLVTVGLEGFYGPKATKRLGVNPGEWAMVLGSDFVENFAIQHIDFASVHVYPDSWIPNADLEEKVKYLSNWVDAHVNDGEYVLKKPVLFTEVGSSLHKNNGTYGRDILLKTVYNKMYDSAKKNLAGAGSLIWQLLVDGMEEYGDEFSLVAWEQPSMYKLIREQSCRLHRLHKEGQMGRKLSSSDPC